MGRQEVADSTWEIQRGRPGVGTLDSILVGGAKGSSSAGHKVLLPLMVISTQPIIQTQAHSFIRYLLSYY